VYRSEIPIFEQVLLLSLNDLSNESHNTWIKCFSSKKKARQQVFESIETLDLISTTDELMWFVSGLTKLWSDLVKGGIKMNYTPEQLTEFGKLLGGVWLTKMKPAERVAGLTPAERLVGLKPAEQLVGLKPAERLAGLKPAERLAGLKAEEVEEIEDCLKQLKKQRH
jgi:hypothetical protein